MSIISTLESKFGRFAIPGLVQIIAILQIIVFLMLYAGPAEMKTGALLAVMPQAEKIYAGQVWLLLSHVLVPPFSSPFACLLTSWFTLWLGRVLEDAWGAFRVNLYVIWLVLSLGVWSLFFGFPLSSYWLLNTLLFAVAALIPNEEILLFFIIPVKMKWIALLDAAAMFFMFLGSPSAIFLIVFANLNFLAAFGPHFLKIWMQRGKVAARRSRFESAQLPQDAFFHQCSVCKKTEIDNPHLEFRVLDSGDEICGECRAKRNGG
ncbi:hypothetical protein [Prosthecobacter sp.]|jgi:hypothetical protein|uniref:hypothetical protein n=1 Tax=Prosthecobacter sp. TaxID=1965333 RepID=UPI0037832A12